MRTLPIPACERAECFDTHISDTSRVLLFRGASVSEAVDCRAALERDGFVQREFVSLGHRSFAAYEKDGCGVFINWFAHTGELQVAAEEDSAYFTYEDGCGPVCTKPRLTQVKLFDYGLSDVIRLSDGRLIIVDGGNTHPGEAEALFARLQADSPHEKPVVAAWIFTHPHSDHFNCFFPFMDKFGTRVELQRFFFHFPRYDDLEHYPKLAVKNAGFSRWSGQDATKSEVTRRFVEKVSGLNVPVYTPRTGQTYTVGDAAIHFVATMDDTIHVSDNINAASLMFFLELGGQRIFFGGDGSFSDARLAQRYGEELKTDILQIPHHGFGCGTDQGQIEGYRLMRPRVCLLPVSLKNAYTDFTTYREGTNYAMTRLGVEEMLTGEAEQVLDLPYEPRPDGEYLLQQRYAEGRANGGARTWVFMDLNTGRREDFMFSVLNTTFYNAALDVEIFIENMQKKIIRIKNTSLRRGVFRLNCLLNPEEDQTAFDRPDFLESLGIPENVGFSVRFISDKPVVISHRDHAPAYHSGLV